MCSLSMLLLVIIITCYSLSTQIQKTDHTDSVIRRALEKYDMHTDNVETFTLYQVHDKKG